MRPIRYEAVFRFVAFQQVGGIVTALVPGGVLEANDFTSHVKKWLALPPGSAVAVPPFHAPPDPPLGTPVYRESRLSQGFAF